MGNDIKSWLGRTMLLFLLLMAHLFCGFEVTIIIMFWLFYLEFLNKNVEVNITFKEGD